jgi:hypothetical protein
MNRFQLCCQFQLAPLQQGQFATEANRVASGWDDSLSDADRTEFAQVTHELMDESDTTDFKCNIPYFELSYERSVGRRRASTSKPVLKAPLAAAISC